MELGSEKDHASQLQAEVDSLTETNEHLLNSNESLKQENYDLSNTTESLKQTQSQERVDELKVEDRQHSEHNPEAD